MNAAAAPITLLPISNIRTNFRFHDGWPIIEIKGDTGRDLIFFQPPAHGKPARWVGTADRAGSDGKQWSRLLGPFVVDDFGFLVEVPQ